MSIGDWTPPAGWTWSDSGGWLPPSDVPEIERLRAENARLETMLQGEIFVRDNLLEALGHEKDLRAENERLRAALEPFASEDVADPPGVLTHDNVELWQLPNRRWKITIGDLRKARAALTPSLPAHDTRGKIPVPPQDSGNR